MESDFIEEDVVALIVLLQNLAQSSGAGRRSSGQWLGCRKIGGLERLGNWEELDALVLVSRHALRFVKRVLESVWCRLLPRPTIYTLGAPQQNDRASRDFVSVGLSVLASSKGPMA
jgi:hypothetical protein